MNVYFATYPWAFDTPGGGEQQLLSYMSHAPSCHINLVKFDPWLPNLEQCDIFHFFSCIGGSVHLCNFVKSKGIPLVISSSLWMTKDTLNQYDCGEIRAQLKLADKIVTNSEQESDALSELLGIDRANFAEVYNGFSTKFLTPHAPELFRDFIACEDEFILCVGNIEPRKNQKRLAEAMRNLPDCKLVLLGHIREEEYFKEVREISGDQMIYGGFVGPNSDLLRSAYSACEVFCLPSLLETPGLAALEACAAGAKIVLTHCGSTREYFGDEVIYCSPLSTSSILQGLTEALEKDSVTYSAAIQKFTWPNVVEKLKDVYAGLDDLNEK